MNVFRKSFQLILFINFTVQLTRTHSFETLNSQKLKPAEARLITTDEDLNKKSGNPLNLEPIKTFQDPAGFPLAVKNERETDRPAKPQESYDSDHPPSKGLPGAEESSKLIINPSNDPLHLSRKPRKAPLLAPIQKFTRWLFVLLTTKNPIWTISFKIFKGIFLFLFRFCYAAIAFQFSVLTQLMVWFWDEILFPMTFPIRTVFWAMVIQPINLAKTILRKLKPIILFLISAITMGVFIGAIGSSTHLAIGDWLFPLHHAKKKNAQTKKSPASVPVSRKKNRHIKTVQRTRIEDDEQLGLPDFKTESPQEDLPQIKEGRGKQERRKLGEEGAGPSLSPEEGGSEEQEEGDEDEDWPEYNLETEMSAALEPNQTGYTSAVEKHVRSASSTRQRHQHHSPSGPGAPTSSKPKPSSSDSVSILKSLLPSHAPATSHSLSLPQSSRKKKVTFKTD